MQTKWRIMRSEAFEEFKLKIGEIEANDKLNCVWQTNTKGSGNDVSCRLEGYMESATAVDAIYTNPKGSQGCLLVVTAAADSSLWVWNGLEGDLAVVILHWLGKPVQQK
jgi:hypothetical protein